MNSAGRFALSLAASLVVGSLASFVALLIMGMGARMFLGGPGILWPDRADPLVFGAGAVAFLVVAFVVFREVSAKLRG